MATFDSIPVIDVAPARGSGPARDRLAEELRDVCHHIGFFVAVDHGVHHSVVDDVFDLMARFFSLDVDDKLHIDKRNSRHFRGWEPEGAEYTNGRPDIREQIDVWSTWAAEPVDVEPAYLRLLGPNQWMPGHLVADHQSVTERWMAECGALADDLLASLAIGLGLDPNHFAQYFGAKPMSLSKLIHYPPTPAGGAGVNAHHDAGFLTVLAPGPTPGLQVRNHDDRWIDVPAVPGGLVINLGEMLQGITGNYFVATPHRVITHAERYSAGYFHGPSLDTSLDPLPLDPRFAAAVDASPHHRSAGWMARRHETADGVGDMKSTHRAAVYGEQLWNYFERSYPDNVARHYPAATNPAPAHHGDGAGR